MLATSRSTAEAEFLKHLPVIERIIAFVARRHYLSAADAEDFGSHVKMKLIENEYGILRKYEGRSSIQTFLSIVIGHLFQDFRNSMWGKWRPSAAARRGGQPAVLLEQYPVRDGLTFGEACEVIRTKHRLELGTSELERISARLPVRFRRRLESEDVLANMAAPGSADRAVLDAERLALADNISVVLKGLRAKLPAEDSHLLSLRYDDGKKVSEIAALCGLEQKPLYGRLKSLEQQLRRALEAEGIDAGTIRELVHDEE